MSTPGASLTDRHTDATLKLIVGTAADLLERGGVDEVTARAVAKAAGMSERTVFRYFASRDAFLDAVAAEVARRIDAPSPPASLEALRDFADPLYRRFEEKAD
ncbi:MAG TPA: helix-turn-helix domain-containing protein, partial [Caulobacteraceae bacterium]|nr:helix-turn-helix domain-containing protein [Caulobacteraceae bacterium]